MSFSMDIMQSDQVDSKKRPRSEVETTDLGLEVGDLLDLAPGPPLTKDLASSTLDHASGQESNAERFQCTVCQKYLASRSTCCIWPIYHRASIQFDMSYVDIDYVLLDLGTVYTDDPQTVTGDPNVYPHARFDRTQRHGPDI